MALKSQISTLKSLNDRRVLRVPKPEIRNSESGIRDWRNA